MKQKLEEFRMCFDNSPIAFCVIRSVKDRHQNTVDLEYVYANKALADIDNSAIDLLIGNTFKHIFPSAGREWLDMFDHAVAGHPSEADTRYIVQLKRYLSIQLYHVKDDYCACIVTDVTAHERQVHEYETQLMLYRTHEKAGVFRVCMDDDFTLLYGNDRYYEMLGYTAESMLSQLGNKCIRYIHPDDVAFVRSTIQKAIDEHKSHARWVMRVISGDGRICHTEVACALILEDSEYIMEGTTIDISDQVEAEDILKYDNQRLNAIIAHADVYYWECDLRDDTAMLDERSQNKFHLSTNKIINYPLSIIESGIIAGESREEFIGLYNAIKSGMPTAQKAIRLSEPYGHGWYLVKFTGAADSSGKPVHAFGTGQSMETYQELEQQFLVTLDQHGLYSWMIDLKYHTSTASDAFMRDYGHPGYFPPLDKLKGLAASRGIYPDDWDLFEDIYRHLYNGETEIRERYRRMNRRTGQWDWIYACYDAIRDASGELSRVIVSAANINRQIEDEERYKTFENYRKLVYENTEASFRFNLTTNWCGDGYSKNSNLSDFTKATTVDEFFAKVYAALASEIELKQYKEVFSREGLLKAFAAGKTMVEAEHRLRIPGGKTVWFNVRAEIAQNPQTNDIEAILYCFDIDHEKMTDSIVSLLIQQDYEFIILLDLDTDTVTQFGGAPEASSGALYESSDYRVNMIAALKELIPAEQLAYAIQAHEIETIKKHLETEGLYQITLTSKTGRYLYWRFSYLREDHSKVLIGRSDITESMRKEQAQRQELEEALRKARIASNAKTEFLANMSHDIRTPMNAIMGMTNLAMEHVDDPVTSMKDLKIVQASARHLLALINDVLDLSYIESGKMLLGSENFSIPSLAQEVTSVMQPNFISKEQDYSVTLETTGHEFFVGDPIRLKQVLINLLSNANKYTQNGGKIHLSIIEHACDIKDHAMIEFRVADNGIGISEDKLASVFTPFFREVNSNLNRVEGTGLGLSIVKTIVDAMGGRIRIESKKGEGTTFYVEVPLGIAPENYMLQKYASLRQTRIFICENERFNGFTLKETLARAGINAESTFDKKEACERVKSNEYDVIIVSMVNLSADMLHDLHEKIKNRSILIAIENGNIDADADEAILSNVDALLPCPVFCSTLCDTIEDQLANRSLAGGSQKYLNGKKLLVVDDNNINRMVAKMMLEGTGAQIVLAEDGSQAVQAFTESKPGEYCAILMDVMMPIMGGYEATKRIRKMKRPDAKTIPIIAMTANAFSEDIRKSTEAGMNAHLTKPMDPSVVRDVLIRLL